jgi:hypothetical protein
MAVVWEARVAPVRCRRSGLRPLQLTAGLMVLARRTDMLTTVVACGAMGSGNGKWRWEVAMGEERYATGSTWHPVIKFV